MSITITRVEVTPWQTALPAPVRGHTQCGGWRIELTDAVGRRGLGEVAVWPGRGGGPEAAERALAQIVETLPGTRWSDAPACVRWSSPEVTAAVSQAVLDLLAQRRNVGLGHLLWPAPAARVSASLLVANADEARRAVSAGFGTLKLKIVGDGQDLVAAVRAVAPDVRLRVDVNGGWSAAEAPGRVAALARWNLELIEQPVPADDLGALAACRGHGVPIGADEAVTDAASLAAVIAARAADVVVLKPMFLGGLRVARALAEQALGAGLEVLVSSAFETALGREALVALASGLPTTYALGLAELPAHPVSPWAPVARRGWPEPLASAAASRATDLAVREVSPESDSEQAIELSWAALHERVAECAGALRALGVRPGTRVGLRAGWDTEWVVHAHAIWSLGAALAPLGPDAETAIATLAPDVVVEPIRRQGAPASLSRPIVLDDTRVVVATTGTTGRPSVVELTGRQLLSSAFASAVGLGLDRADRWVACLPFHHVGGLSVLIRSALYGTTVELHERFDPQRVLASIESGATLVSLVPPMLRRLVERLEIGDNAGDNTADNTGDGATHVPRSLRAILVGGGPTPPALQQRALAVGLPIAVTWGFTEAASQVATTLRRPGDAPAEHLQPLPGGWVHSDGERLAVTGPIVGGTVLSNDRGAVGPAGVQVFGRSDFTIVSGGLNLDPFAIERCLGEHPAVGAVVVVGVDDAIWGQRPAALLVPRGNPSHGNVTPDDATLKRWCRTRMSGPECPETFHWVQELPLRGPGKIDRRAAARWLTHEEDV